MTSSLVGSEMCIRDRSLTTADSELGHRRFTVWDSWGRSLIHMSVWPLLNCLLYTSDAADDM
eukprot:9607218-Prorocentrum_lima.AAC.1